MYTGNAWANAQQQPGFANAYSQRGQAGNQSNQQFGPAALIPIGASMLGGLMGGIGGSKNKSLNYEELMKMFGPGAIGAGADQLFGSAMQSPVFQQIMSQGAGAGNRLQQRMNQNLGKSGLSGSPMGQFGKAAAQGYGGNMQNQMLANLYMQMMKQSQMNNQNMMNMYAGQQQNAMQPNFWDMMGSSLIGGGAQGLLGLKK